MADSKLTGLTADTAIVSGDLLYLVDDVGGQAQSKKITIDDFFGATTAVPVTVTLGNKLLLDDARAVGAPDLTWDGFATTGLYMPADNVIGFVTSGTEKARLVGGNLLIGTTMDLGHLLQVRKDTAGATTTLTVFNGDNTNVISHARINLATGGGLGGDPYIQYGTTATTWVGGIDNSDGDKWKLSRGAVLGTNDAIVVDVTNNVGIRSSSPGACLDVFDAGTGAVQCVRVRQDDVNILGIVIENSTYGTGAVNQYRMSVADSGSGSMKPPDGKQLVIQATSGGFCRIQQASTTGAAPCLELDQDDIDEEFIEFDGNSAASAASSITTFTTGQTIQGHIQITVNGVKRWLAFYDDPTA